MVRRTDEALLSKTYWPVAIDFACRGILPLSGNRNETCRKTHQDKGARAIAGGAQMNRCSTFSRAGNTSYLYGGKDQNRTAAVSCQLMSGKPLNALAWHC